MKLITLHQPWASLVARGLKQYETRHWATIYRGPLLIHAASRRMKKIELAYLRCQVEGIRADALNLALERIERSPNYGCIVAVVNLTACLQMYGGSPFLGAHASNSIRLDSQSAQERAVGCWEAGRYALRLDEACPLPQPISFTSRQGKLLDVSETLALMVRNQLEVHHACNY